MEEKLKKSIEAMVASIFSEKEESEVRRQTEEALQTSAATIEELTTTLEAKNVELEEAKAQVSSLEEAKVELDTKLEAAGTEKADVESKLEEAKAKLAAIETAKILALRMEELTTAGVVRKDSEAQAAKVSEMSDEEFASYKEELEAVKASIMESMEKAAEEEVASEEGTDGASDDAGTEDASEEDSEGTEEASEEEDEVQTPPANVNPAHAAEAAMNMEVASVSDEIGAKYADLGKAMAAVYTDKE